MGQRGVRQLEQHGERDDVCKELVRGNDALRARGTSGTEVRPGSRANASKKNNTCRPWAGEWNARGRNALGGARALSSCTMQNDVCTSLKANVKMGFPRALLGVRTRGCCDQTRGCCDQCPKECDKADGTRRTDGRRADDGTKRRAPRTCDVRDLCSSERVPRRQPPGARA